ncbi:baseplate J/gp47 family protein [uncultured Desulfobacter sp.]|uniref:baseplate J/gp47 family protein n=1 Tax=uncultured Desulfobacter sp. TaxID=240139 RepID=UPI0029F5649C|nr:baseplate J/gp47 family protein [uncultured Desulfobacter sp.]
MADTDIFENMLNEAGIPITEAGIQAQWDRIAEDADILISNDSDYSPFWRLISAIVTTPAKWLVNLLIQYVLPNAFLKYATGAWLDLFAWGRDLERKDATAVTGNILFTRDSSGGDLIIEAGILIATPAINDTVYRLVVSEDTTIPDGTLSAYIPVVGENAGADYNLGAGYYSVLPEAISGIESVVNDSNWITTEGADEESDDALRLRCRNQFSAVGQYHHDAAYRADIATFAGIRTDYIKFEHDAPRGPGTANAYIMIDSGAPAQAFVDDINDYISTQGHHGHGDDMLCMVMPTTAYALEATVYYDTNLAAEKVTALETEVENIIRYVFRENQAYDGQNITRTFSLEQFSFSKLDQELHNLLEDLMSIHFSLSDIIPVTIDLPVLSSLTITMEAVS